MKRLTLNRSWKLCLQMWKWIAEQVKKGRVDINNLKWNWLEEHDFDNAGIENDCFFCEYSTQQGDDGCLDCPAVIVSKRFCCANKTYHYKNNPIAFYEKLLELNKKRLKAVK